MVLREFTSTIISSESVPCNSYCKRPIPIVNPSFIAQQQISIRLFPGFMLHYRAYFFPKLFAEFFAIPPRKAPMIAIVIGQTLWIIVSLKYKYICYLKPWKAFFNFSA